MADIYEGMHMGSIETGVYTTSKIRICLCVLCVYVYIGNTTLMYVYICMYRLYKAS